MQVAASASVRRASVPGAVATASTATSVERVSRAAAITLVRPMKNAGTQQREREVAEVRVLARGGQEQRQHAEGEHDAEEEGGVTRHPACLDDGHRAQAGEAGRGHGKSAHGDSRGVVRANESGR